MTKARDLANAGTALTSVSATELGYLDGVTSAVQTQINSKIAQATAINPTIVDAKGDIVAATAADTVARLAVGANDTVLTADSSTATGLKWAAPASSSGPAFRAYRSGSGGQSITSGVTTKVQLNAESFDTDNCYDPTTNYRFTPNKAGYYQINCTFSLGSSTTITRFVGELYFNGAQYLRPFDAENRSVFNGSGSFVMYFNGTTDYAEMYVYATGTGINISDNLAGTIFSGVWIRS